MSVVQNLHVTPAHQTKFRVRPLTLINLVLLAFLAHSLSAQAREPQSIDLATQLEPFRAEGKIPGMVALVIQGDRIVAQGAVGVRKLGSPGLITLDDQFHLGSCTKAMTATLAAMLVEEGKLNWNSTLGELFGDDLKNMQPAWKKVTLQQVLAHRSGLPDNLPLNRDPPVLAGKSLRQQRETVVAIALSHQPETKPGEKEVYSNLGYIVIGAVLEKITNRSWEELIEERLFKPLGITTGGFGAPGAPGKLDQPWGHDDQGVPIDPGDPLADNPKFFGPCGTVHMTVTDWAKFITLHLRGDPANPNAQAALLKPETFARLHQAAPGRSYNAGWAFQTRNFDRGDAWRVFSHNGSNGLWYCIVLAAPETDFAVLVASNQGMDRAAKPCGDALNALAREFIPKHSVIK